MEITQIQYFLEVAKSQHITQSAQKLHIAQPALSQSIKRLESELGVELFQKKGRNVVLTEYGKYLQSQLEPIMEKLDALPQALQKMAKLNNETIHLNVLAASTIVTDAVIEYQSKHKEINFQIVRTGVDDMADIEITTNAFKKIELDSKNEFGVSEKIYLAVPNNEKYKNVSSVDLKDVDSEQFISLMGSRQFRYICDQYCHRAGINPHIIFESDSPSAVKNMIGANLGIGFWPEFTWGKIDSDNVKLLEISNDECTRDIVVSCNPARLENEIVKDFFEHLKEYIERQKESYELG